MSTKGKKKSAKTPEEIYREKRKKELAKASKAAEYLANFNKVLEDDLSTPRALAELWGIIRDPSVTPEEALAIAIDMDEVLGLNLSKEMFLQPRDDGMAAEIESLIEERNVAKKAKNYERADEIRKTLKARGIILEDSPTGTTYRRS